MTDREVARVAARQHGLVTRTQALERGLTGRQLEVRVAAGRWVPLRRGVFAVAGTAPSERQTVLAACLAAGDVHASHLTAARLWGLRFPETDTIHILGARRRLDGVTAHQSTSVVAADLAELGAIPITSPARTIADCAGTVPASQLGEIVDDALRRGLVRLEALRVCHERVDTGPGRRPTVALRAVLLERSPGYAAGDLAREASLVRLLATSGLPAPVLGHRVRVGRHVYKLDVSWPEFLVALEYDSWEFHRTHTAFHRDRQRLRRLTAAGWTILPVTARTDLHELVGDVFRLTWREATA